MIDLRLGDCLKVLKDVPSNSIDACVTDPPYGLSFMGKSWDYDVPSVAIWREVFRVLKPGGHLVSFSGTRTYHMMTVKIENAGFEIRDMLSWLYGSGFPKSHNVSKGIDNSVGAKRLVVGTHPNPASSIYSQGLDQMSGEVSITSPASPASPAAKKWDGWGSALKPAMEPAALCMKPLEDDLTIADNVMKHGTGALNIDASRIGTETIKVTKTAMLSHDGQNHRPWHDNHINSSSEHQGRWPANLILDEVAAEMLDAQVGHLHGAGNKRLGQADDGSKSMFGIGGRNGPTKLYDIGGGASRFFYCAKASKRERNAGLEGMPEQNTWTDTRKPNSNDIMTMKRVNSRTGELEDRKDVTRSANHHPTVKPVALMEYLVRLITPPGGVVLDPFMGSGSTGCAAAKLGFSFLGIEMNEEYLEIARRRIAHFEKS